MNSFRAICRLVAPVPSRREHLVLALGQPVGAVLHRGARRRGRGHAGPAEQRVHLRDDRGRTEPRRRSPGRPRRPRPPCPAAWRRRGTPPPAAGSTPPRAGAAAVRHSCDGLRPVLGGGAAPRPGELVARGPVVGGVVDVVVRLRRELAPARWPAGPAAAPPPGRRGRGPARSARPRCAVRSRAARSGTAGPGCPPAAQRLVDRPQAAVAVALLGSSSAVAAASAATTAGSSASAAARPPRGWPRAGRCRPWRSCSSARSRCRCSPWPCTSSGRRAGRRARPRTGRSGRGGRACSRRCTPAPPRPPARGRTRAAAPDPPAPPSHASVGQAGELVGQDQVGVGAAEDGPVLDVPGQPHALAQDVEAAPGSR